MDLSKSGFRERLKAKREPYWQRIRNGCFLGFRPTKRDGPGTWIARAYDPDTSRYRVRSLGDLGQLTPRERFTAAKAQAENFAELVETGGHSCEKIETVEQACRAYAKEKPEADKRLERLVYSDPLGNIRLEKLRRHHLYDWRRRLEERPVLVSRSRNGKQQTRERAPASVNRDMVPIRAALNRVLAQGAPGTEAAWQEALKPIRNADRQRTLYLDLSQRRKLLTAVDPAARPFLQALCLLPLRPGAMAKLSVKDFNARTRELTIGEDKTGRPRRLLVPETAAQLMTEQSAAKFPGAPLFMRVDGKRWSKDSWNQPITEATGKAGLPAGVTAYTLRHSVLTDLVDGGLPLLTVAQISATSVEMIERHYGHLNKWAAEKALAQLAI